MNELEELYLRLDQLENYKRCIDEEIERIRYRISVLSPFTKEQKIALFRSLFIGREDVYARHWISKDGMKSGYSPATYTFRGNDYRPMDNRVIQLHLEGKIRIGTYVVFDQTMTRFLAFDLDKKSYVEDARAIVEVCRSLQLDPIVEVSKSGEGMHVWLFFETPVRARDARALGDLILTRAMDIADGIDMRSYDRMFPHQDFVEPGSLGNLIALPLHYGSRRQNRTVFIDIDTLKLHTDQWAVLRHVRKISPRQLRTILDEYRIDTGEESLMPWQIKEEPLCLPKRVHGVLYDALYIERDGLSKAVVNRLVRFASFPNPEYYILQKLRKSTFKTPRIVTLHDMNTRYLILPRGLSEKVEAFFASHDCRLSLEDKRTVRHIEGWSFSIRPRPEQAAAIATILDKEYALLIAPPGFGKTFVAAAVIAERKVDTLILVHKTTLLEQWVERLSYYYSIDMKSIGMLGKGKKRLTGIIDIATLQSMKNRPELIESYTQVIIDEAHHIPAVTYETPLKRFRGKYLLGLSATPFRKDGMHPVMFMQCGPVAYEAKEKNRPMHRLKIITTSFETLEEDFASILNELAICQKRNEQIVDHIISHADRNILLLSERIEHLNILYHMLRVKNIDAILLHGALGNKLQKEMKQQARRSNVILSTSSYMGEGIDLGHLDTIFFTMPISYTGRLVQYIGRIGRQGQSCVAVDFIDERVPMLKASFRKRMSGYRKMGYVETKSDQKGLFTLFSC